MAVTRINNNQISDASAGNIYVGINAAVKLQDYSITATKISNSLTYGSDLTITGNLTVQGNTTTIDTTFTTIEDPVILLASNQTGSPTVDIGFIGERGTSNNIAFVWDESAGEFVTAFTSSAETNTTITISSFASFKTLDATVTGNLSTAGFVTVTGNITSGNLISNAQVIATGNVTGGNVNTAGQVVATGNVTGGNVTTVGQVVATGNVTGGNLITGAEVIAVGNVTGGNVNTAGQVTATGNVNSGNVNTSIVSASGNVTGGNLITGGLVTATGNVTGGNVLTGGLISATGNVNSGANIVATANVVGGNLTTAGVVTATGNVTGGNLNTAGQVTATGNVNSGNVNTGIVSASGNVNGTGAVFSGNVTASYFFGNIAGNIDAAGSNTQVQFNDVGDVLGASANFTFDKATNILSVTGNVQATTVEATGNVIGGNVSTVGLVSATGNVLGGNINTAGQVEATGNVTAGNLVTSGRVVASGNIVSLSNIASGNLAVTGTITSSTIETTGNIFVGGNLTVQGNITYINVDDLRVEDPIIIMGTGPNGAPLTADDGMDRGIYMEYFYTATGKGNASVFFDNSTGNIVAAANVNFSGNNIVNVVQYGTFQAGNIYSESAVVAGNVTGGNLITAGQTVATGNITGGNLITAGQTVATGNITGGNLITAGQVTATGNVTGGNLITAGLGSFGTTVTATGNITGGNLITAGQTVATGNVTGGNLITAGLGSFGTTVTATGNITGGNVATAGQIVATGNVTSGNINTAGIVSASGNVNGSGAVFSGNVTAANFIGNISGNVDAGGANTNIQFNDGDILAGSAALTFDKTSNAVVASGNVTAGNVLTGGLIDATGNITGGNLITAGLATVTGNVIGGNINTAGQVVATGNVNGGNVVAVALVSGANVSATSNVTGANIVGTTSGTFANIRISSSSIDSDAARITINGADADVDFAVDGDTAANVFYVDAGTSTASFGSSTQTTNAIVAFNATTSILLPVGNTAQRPDGVTGMLRFNSTQDAVEVYDLDSWVSVGVPVFTVITDDQFAGNGVQTIYTLANVFTTNSVIVSINGVVQIPTTAYSVSGNALTFTEAPQQGDFIDVRGLTTTTQVTSISNSPGNAIVAVNSTVNEVNITGNLLPVANNTQSLGSQTLRWKDLYVAGNSIYIGNIVMKNTSGNTVAFYGPDGSTPATIDSTNVDTTTIASGTSNVRVQTSNGNIAVGVGGSNIVRFTTDGIVNDMGNGVGNIGNATGYFNTAFVKATSAQYADLAEIYAADAKYEPGTVLSFGGNKEVTLSTSASDCRIAGVVSTNPSYVMNATLEAEYTATVALTGRVPTKVSGPVTKGDMMISAGNGRAMACATPAIGTVIGKALANHSGQDGVIEVVVGRL